MLLPEKVDSGIENDGERSLINKRVLQVSCGAYHCAAVTVRAAPQSQHAGSVLHPSCALDCRHPFRSCSRWGICTRGAWRTTDGLATRTLRCLRIPIPLRAFGARAAHCIPAVRPLVLGLMRRCACSNPRLPCLVRYFQDPALFPSGLRIMQVSCGFDHTLCLDSRGDVYSWGAGRYGQLGHGDLRPRGQPEPVKALRGRSVRLVRDGAQWRACIARRGRSCCVYPAAAGCRVQALAVLHQFGRGVRVGPRRQRAAGHGGVEGEAAPAALARRGATHTACGGLWCGWQGHLTPVPVVELEGERVVQVAAGESHSGAPPRRLAAAPRALREPLTSPRRVPPPPPPAALTNQGLLYTWGAGAYGRLGHGDEEDAALPRVVDSLRAVPLRAVACGGFHTLVIALSGRLYAFGGGQHGKLGHGDAGNRGVPMVVENILGGKFVTQVCAAVGQAPLPPLRSSHAPPRAACGVRGRWRPAPSTPRPRWWRARCTRGGSAGLGGWAQATRACGWCLSCWRRCSRRASCRVSAARLSPQQGAR